MELSLAASGLAVALIAAVYAWLAARLWERPGAGAVRRATRDFASYWACVALYDTLSAIQLWLASVGIAPFAFALVVRFAGLGIAVIGIGFLLAYILYIRTGDMRWRRRVAIVYAAALLVAWIHIARSVPTGVAITAWTVDVTYARDFNTGLFLPLLVIIQLLPMLAAVWYALLLRRTREATQRRRVAAVGLGVGVQLLSFMVARLVRDPAWALVAQVIVGVSVAALVTFAYARRPGRVGMGRPSAEPRG